MSYLRTDTEYRDYFNSLSESHKEIESFAYGDDERLSSDNANAQLKGWILWVDEPRPAIVEGHPDNYVARLIAPVVAMKAVSNSSHRHADQDEITEAAKDICTDVISKMLRDSTARKLEKIIQFDVIGTQLGRFDSLIGSTRFIGYLAEIPIRHPLNLSYNEDKWND